MTLPADDTVVTYPDGAIEGRARVLHVAPVEGGLLAVVVDTTPIHPVEARWPDQQADAGVLRTAAGDETTIVDAVVGATDGTALHLGADVPVRPGTEGWAFVVAHLVPDGTPVAEGDEIGLRADAALRRALSIGHTACHLASLALNHELADRWTKTSRTDALGAPDFDGVAIESSRITPFGSIDRFRLNKSLRRAGFDASGLLEASERPDLLDELAARVDRTLAAWIATDAPVRIERDGDRLTDRRSWVCELPDAAARIPCGGTHATSLGELGATRVEFALDDDAGTPVLVMVTTSAPAAAGAALPGT